MWINPKTLIVFLLLRFRFYIWTNMRFLYQLINKDFYRDIINLSPLLPFLLIFMLVVLRESLFYIHILLHMWSRFKSLRYYFGLSSIEDEFNGICIVNYLNYERSKMFIEKFGSPPPTHFFHFLFIIITTTTKRTSKQ